MDKRFTIANIVHNQRTNGAFVVGGRQTAESLLSCSIENDTVQLLGNIANTMGTVTMTDSTGVKGMVEKTWTYWQAAPNELRIVLHHSSSPFDAR